MSTHDSQLSEQNSHTEREWQKKFFAMGAQCYYCEKPLLLGDATKDHKTPKCRGGSSHITNIVPACLPCNQKKGWRTVAEFALVRSMLGNPKLKQRRRAIEILEPTPLPILSMDDSILLRDLQRERNSLKWWRQ